MIFAEKHSWKEYGYLDRVRAARSGCFSEPNPNSILGIFKEIIREDKAKN